MAIVPIIQPPIMKALTTEEERKIVMEQLRPVSKKEKIIFPIMITVIVTLLLPLSRTVNRYANVRKPHERSRSSRKIK